MTSAFETIPVEELYSLNIMLPDSYWENLKDIQEGNKQALELHTTLI